jgi:hypothetical protein
VRIANPYSFLVNCSARLTESDLEILARWLRTNEIRALNVGKELSLVLNWTICWVKLENMR